LISFPPMDLASNVLIHRSHRPAAHHPIIFAPPCSISPSTKVIDFGVLLLFYLLFCLYFRLLYCCLLDYFLLMIIGVWVLFCAVDPTFLDARSMVVLSSSVSEGFLSTLVLPLFAVLCGRLCYLDGPDHSFDPFPTVLWFWFFFGTGFWLVQGICLGCPPFSLNPQLSLPFGSKAVRTLLCNLYPYLLRKKKSYIKYDLGVINVIIV
jgi:hypothetical protein